MFPPPRKQDDEREPHAVRPRRVVIVEDQWLVAAEFEATLSNAGHSVLAVCASADEAIAACRADPPDFVLMDIRLIGTTDGVDAALEIYRTQGVRSVFVTAHDDAPTRSRAAPAQPLDWLLKPVSPRVLLAAVAAVP